MTWLAAQGKVAPLVASTAPIPMAETVFRWVNEPPTMTRDWSGETTNDHTMASAFGAHGSSAPLAELNALSSLRTLLPTAA